MSKKLFGVMVLISMLALATLAGCQSQANSGTTVSGASVSSDSNTIFGQVTAVDGNNITVALIDNSGMGNGRQGQGNQGASSSNRPQRSQGSRPSGNWEQPQGSGGTVPSGGRSFGLNLTGESKTFTVTSSTTITSGGMRQYSQNSSSAPASASASPAALSDIQKGSILSVKLSGDNAVSITIMQLGGRNGNGANAQAGKSPAPGDSVSASQTDAQPSPNAAPSPSASATLSSGATPTPSIGAISSY